MSPLTRITDFAGVDVAVQRQQNGAFGRVYMGPDRLHDNRWLAIKTLRPELLKRAPRVQELFVQEALIWVGLWPHPNLISANYVTQINSQPALVLEYAEHGSLRQWINGHTMTLDAALELSQMIAAGLIALHTPDPERLRPFPIIHRDLKPENILLDQNWHAKITDLGLAKSLQESVTLAEGDSPVELSDSSTHFILARTEHGAVFGTPAYMAPEQWDDASTVTPAVDIYAAGIILTELLTGRHPFLDFSEAASIEHWRFVHTHLAAPSLRRMVPELPEPLEEMRLACLAKNPSHRPTANELLTTLQASAMQRGEQHVHPVSEAWPTTPEYEASWWHNWASSFWRFDLNNEALVRIQRALELSPTLPYALLTQGHILKGLDRDTEALQAYEAALAALPAADVYARSVTLNGKANLLSGLGRYADAELAHVGSLELFADSPITWSNRADNERLWYQSVAHEGDDPEAMRHGELCLHHLEQARRLDPNNADLWRRFGVAAAALGHYEEALASYAHALDLIPANTDAWIDQGKILAQQGRHEEAVASYTQALHLDPSNADAYYREGVSLTLLERYQDALEAFAQARVCDPANASAWYNEGVTLAEVGRYEEAVVAHRHAREIDPTLIVAWRGEGYSLVQLGRYEEAESAYRQSLSLDPRNPGAWFYYGFSLAALNRHEEALDAYAQARCLNTTMGAVQLYRGISLAALERHEEALAAYEQALRLAPNNLEAQLGVASALEELGRYIEALPHYQRLVELVPEEATNWRNLANVLATLGQYVEALTAAQQALVLQPDHPIGFMRLAAALSGLGRYEEALAAFYHADQEDADVWDGKAAAYRGLGREVEARAADASVSELRGD